MPFIDPKQGERAKSHKRILPCKTEIEIGADHGYSLGGGSICGG